MSSNPALVGETSRPRMHFQPARSAAVRGRYQSAAAFALGLLAVTSGVILPSKALGAQTHLKLPEQLMDSSAWKLVGTNPELHVRPAEQSIDISIGPDDKAQSVGFAPSGTLKGDFEIRGEYEIDEISTPKQGFGCGPSIYLTTRSPQKLTATIGRLNRVSDGERYSAYWANTVKGERKHHPQLTKATGSRGVLSLKRTGTSLTYCVGENWDGPLEVIRTVEFGDDDVNYIRIGLDRGGDSQAVRMRWHRVLVVSGSIDQLASQPTITSSLVKVSGNNIILGILFAVAVGFSASWWFVRGRYLL